MRDKKAFSLRTNRSPSSQMLDYSTAHPIRVTNEWIRTKRRSDSYTGRTGEGEAGGGGEHAIFIVNTRTIITEH